MLGGFNPFDLGGLSQPSKTAKKGVKKSTKEVEKPHVTEKTPKEEVKEEPKKEVKPVKKEVKKEVKKDTKKTAKVVKPSKRTAASSESAEKEYQRKMRLAFEAQFGQVDGVAEEEEEEEESESDSDDNNNDFDDEEDLVELSKTYVEQPSDEDMESDSEEEEEEEEVKEEGPIVVKFTGSDRGTRNFNEKAEKKRFMSRKTPLNEIQKEEKEKIMAEKNPRKPMTKEEQEEEQEDLQNDVALQRLISESSILHSQAAQSSFSGADISFLDDGPIGKARLKTLSSRIESLGGKHIPLQKNMPMLTRKMVNQKFQNKVKAEQEHAAEAGIILAKTAPVDNRFSIRKKKVVKRDRGLKINSVGKSTSGGIKLSKHEIRKFGGKI